MTSLGRHVVSNHRSFVFLKLMPIHIKETLLVHRDGNAPVTGEFPTQRVSNAEKLPVDNVIMKKYMYTFFSTRNGITF